MKRLSVLLLAGLMALSMAGCSENADSSSKAAVREVQIPRDDSSAADVSAPGTKPDNKDSGDVSMPEDDILVPAATEAQELAGSEHSDYSFFIKTVDHSDPDAPRQYEGEIVDDAVKEKIFDILCNAFEREELSFEGEPTYTNDGLILTLKNAGGDEYRISAGCIDYDFLMYEGIPVFFLTTPDSVLCFETNDDELDELGKLLSEVLNSKDGFNRTDSGDIFEVKIPDGAEKPEFPVTYISVRSGYDSGIDHISGAFLDSRGYMYTFNLTEDLDRDLGSTGYTDMILKNLMKGNGNIEMNGVCADVSYINEGLDHAAKIDPDLEFDEESVMEDYGQNTLYAVVGGELVMLESFGDVNKTSEDENVQSAISSYKQAFNT